MTAFFGDQNYDGVKAFLIARVSDPDQRDALPAQELRLVEYAKKHKFAPKLYSFDETAFKEDRKKFVDITNEIARQKEFCVIVFDKIDRFTRDSSSEIVRLFKDLAKDGKVELHFPSDGLIYHQNSPACDKARLGMGMVFGEYYSAAISDNVKRKIEQKLHDGEWPGQAPFGYRNIEIGKKKWVEQDDNAHIVVAIYQMYASGAQSFRSICAWLSDTHNINKRASWIEHILKNPFYYGHMRVKGKLYKHRYTPIISKDLFNAAQATAKSYNKTPYKYAGKPYIYRGLITCRKCGCRITPEKSKGHIYYHCTQSKGKHGAAYVREEALTEQIEQALGQIHPTQEQYDEVIAALKYSHADKIKFKDDESSRLNAELAKLESRSSRLFDLYMDGDIAKDFYKGKNAELESKRDRLTLCLGSLDDLSDDYYKQGVRVMELVRNAPLLFRMSSEMDEKRKIIKVLFQNLELDGKQLGWKYKKPFDEMAFCRKNANWLPLVVLFRAHFHEIRQTLCSLDTVAFEARIKEITYNEQENQVPLSP